MKVGVVVDNEFYTDVRVKREVSLLMGFGFEVFVLCFNHNKAVGHDRPQNIQAVYLPRSTKNALYFFMNLLPLYEWWWTRQVKDFVVRNKLDVVHTHDLYMARSVKKGIKASGKEIPLILDLHENYPHAIKSYKWTQGLLRSLLTRPNNWEKKEGSYLSYADKIIVLSEGFKRDLLAKYATLNKEQFVVFPNVVDIEQFDQYAIDKEIKAKLPKGLKVLYFGMVAERRGIFESLEVFKSLIMEGLDFHMVIIGPVDGADKERFEKLINEEVVRNNVVHIPWIDLSELPSYLDACGIALAPFEKNPQHESGIANKIFQYMYGGLPILASNCKPQQELIERYSIGKVFDSVADFKEKLRWLIIHEEARKDMGRKARHVLMSEFHQDSYSPVLLGLYETLKDHSATN